MGYALLWIEGMAVALLGLALAARWAVAKGSIVRFAGVGLVFLTFFGLAAVATLVTGSMSFGRMLERFIPADLFAYALSWLLVYLIAAVLLLRRAFQRPAPGMARTGAGWPRNNLWLGCGAGVLLVGLTFWNLNLAARADLAVARQEAGDILLTMTPAPVGDSENAVRLLLEAKKAVITPIRNPWGEAAWRGLFDSARPEVNWTDPYVVGLVAKQEKVLALLRQAAALPPGNLDGRISLDDPNVWKGDRGPAIPLGSFIRLLAVDARVKAAQGDHVRALEDVTAILGMSRHTPTFLSALVDMTVQNKAWGTLEDVLRLAPAAKGPVPSVRFPRIVSPLLAIHREMAVMGMICPTLLSQDPLRYPEIRRLVGPWSTPPLVWLTETVATPGSRIFLMPAELRYSRKKWEEYRRVLHASEEPRDWVALRELVHQEQTGLYSALYIKPKEKKLLQEMEKAAPLEQLARTGLAVARYRDKHGSYPERLEQLVPAFLPAMPTDPRDGQPLRLKHFTEVSVLHTAKSSPGLEAEPSWDADKHREEPVFRLYPRRAAK